MDTAIAILSFMLGATVGSFLNVVICRSITDESIVFPPSHCPKCNHRLAPRDLIPILSYIVLKGHCRYCKEKISLQYPLIEALTAVLFVLITTKYGLTAQTLVLLTVTATMISTAVIDLKTKEVPYMNILIATAIVTVVILLGDTGISLKDRLLGAGIGFVPLFVFYLIGGMGDGDFFVSAFLGFSLGIAGVIKTLFVAFTIGGIYGICLLSRNINNRKKQIPFVPFLAIGSTASMFFNFIF